MFNQSSLGWCRETAMAIVLGVLAAAGAFCQDYEPGGDFTKPHTGERVGYIKSTVPNPARSWAGDLAFEVAGKDVPTTDRLQDQASRGARASAGLELFRGLPISPVSLQDAVDGRQVVLVLVKDFIRMENAGRAVQDVEFERYFPMVDEEQLVLGRWVAARTDDNQSIPISLAKVTPDGQGNLIHTWHLSSFPASGQVLVTVSALVARRERPRPKGPHLIPPAEHYPPAVRRFLQSSAMVASEHPEIKQIAEKLLKETQDPYVLAGNLAKMMKGKSYKQAAGADRIGVPTAVAVQRWGGSCCASAVSAMAILRACGIPAQITYCPAGYIHGVTRFYLQDYGWLRMDSTCGVGKLPFVQDPGDLGLARLFDMPWEMENGWANYAWPYYHNDTQGEYRFLAGGAATKNLRFAHRRVAQEAEQGPAPGYTAEPYPHYEPGSWNRVLGGEAIDRSWRSGEIEAASREAVASKTIGAFAELIGRLPKSRSYVEFVEREIKLETQGGTARNETTRPAPRPAQPPAAEGAGNLLLNGSAEQGAGDRPLHWFAARVPAEGLKMERTSGICHSGQYSLSIVNDHPSGKLVSNNWAQEISTIPQGKTIRVEGWIRTEGAEAVNLCVQCWNSKDRLVALSSTRVVRGNQDWLHAQSEPMVVPAETTSLIVRAALTGRGKAWFDDLSLTVAGSQAPDTSEPRATDAAARDSCARAPHFFGGVDVPAGIAVIASSLDKELPAREVVAIVKACRLNVVVIDFAWITHHWPRTDLATVNRLVRELQAEGVMVAAMYRPRGSSPAEAKVHWAQDPKGTIPKDHNHLCFAHADSVEWGLDWGKRILTACPGVEHLMLYNVAALCQCEQCRQGRGAKHAEAFIARCREEWHKVRPTLEIGHVGVADEYAAVVDFLCPFLALNREPAGSSVDTRQLASRLKALQQAAHGKPLLPLVKVCWADETRNDTSDVIHAIRDCQREGMGFILWEYGWIFRSEDHRYDPLQVLTALGGHPDQMHGFFGKNDRQGNSDSRSSRQPDK
jgi:hypothetical protein